MINIPKQRGCIASPNCQWFVDSALCESCTAYFEHLLSLSIAWGRLRRRRSLRKLHRPEKPIAVTAAVRS